MSKVKQFTAKVYSGTAGFLFFTNIKTIVVTKIFLSFFFIAILLNKFLDTTNEYSNLELAINQQKVYQYMAVCTDGHGVLSPWMDTQEAANKYGKDHEVLTKGHRWRIDTREKPQPKKDTTSKNSDKINSL